MEGGGEARAAGQVGVESNGSRQIPYIQLEDATGGFATSQKIGQGGSGSVFSARWNYTQVCLALYYVVMLYETSPENRSLRARVWKGVHSSNMIFSRRRRLLLRG
jgi:hypothetical protein